MSLYQFSAYCAGWARAHGSAQAPAPTDAEMDALLRASDEMDARLAGVDHESENQAGGVV